MATYRITIELTGMPPEKVAEATKRISDAAEQEAHRASSWPNHPHLDGHSLVGVDVTLTTVINGGGPKPEATCPDCYGTGVVEGELCPLCKGR